MLTDDASASAPAAANPVEPDATSPVSNNTMPSTLDQLALSPRAPSAAHSRSQSPANAVSAALPTENAPAPTESLRASSSTGSLSRPHEDTEMDEERPAKRQRSAYDDSVRQICWPSICFNFD